MFDRPQKAMAGLACASLLCAAIAGVAKEGRDPRPLAIQEDLVLGLDEQRPLGYIGDVAVDSKGNIYVLDTGYKSIRKYAEDGEYLRDIGAEGEGPGEFYGPICLAVAPDDRIFVGGVSTIIAILAPDGKPAGQVKRVLSSPVRSMVFDEHGNLYIVALDILEQTMIHKYAAPDYEHALSFGESYAVGRDDDTRVEAVYGGGFLDYGTDGLLYYVQWAPQLVRTYSTNGELVATHKARFEDSPFPEPELEGSRVTFSLPPMSTPIVCLRDGWFLTGQSRQVGNENEYRVVLDVYSSEGMLDYSSTREGVFTPKCRDREYRLFIAEERNDVPVIVRYQAEIPISPP